MRLLLFFLIISITIFFSCNTTEPEMKVQYPPGYQHDIPWPSLADSPWPMYRGDPQNTCRTKFTASVTGQIYKIYKDSIFFNSPATADNNGNIYFIASRTGGSSSLYSMSSEGIINWIFPFNSNNLDNPAPVILNDGTILAFSPYSLKLYAISYDGKIKWEKNNIRVTMSGINISKDGTLFFINYDGTIKIYAVKDSVLLWNFGDVNLRGSEGASIAISPDEKTLYVPGTIDVAALMAFDIKTKSIKWSFGKKRMINPAVVDAFGKIYFITNLNDNELYLYCLNESGHVLWDYPLNVNVSNADIGNTMVSIDKKGNLLFGNDTLTSLNYQGKINWKFAIPDGFKVMDHITIDGNNNIIFKDWGNRLLILNDKGKLINKIVLPSEFRSGYPCIIDSKGMIHVVSWRDKKLITIK